MKKSFLIFSAAIFSLLLTSCIQNSDEQYDVEDFQNDVDSYYKEYEDDDELSDDEASSAVWDVNFSFLGTINNGELNDGDAVAADTGSDSGEAGDDDETNDDDTGTPAGKQNNIIYGSGLLTYLNLLNETVTINSSAWALKKSLTLASGHKVPIIQVFFADNSSNTDEDGYVTYFILQLEGSSVSSKSETYYLNNDKLYKAKVKLDSDGGISEICYIQEPDSTKGKVNIYTNNIRIGEELKVDGYADMLDMEVKECKVMN